jgi:MYXO-CTERM domain-containing protein
MSQTKNLYGAVIRQASTTAHKCRFALPLLGIAALASLVPTSAKAALTLTLTELSGPDAGATATASDPTNTEVIYALPVGDFSTNIDVGFSNLNSGGAEATLQVHTLDITSNVSVPVVLQVSLTDNGFTFPGGSGSTLNLTSSVAATFVSSNNGDSVQFQSTAFDNTQSVSTPLQTTVSSGGLGSVAGSLAPDQSVPFTRGASYSLENVAIMSFSQANEQENVGGTTTTLVSGASVPDPTSLGAIAVGGLLMMRRRRSA